MPPSVFDPGLESITVAETELSHIDGEAGEFVLRGYPIEDLAANATYEEVCHLLFADELPTDADLDAFRRDLAARRAVGEEVRGLVEAAAAAGRGPMDALRTGVAAADVDADCPAGDRPNDDRVAVAKRLVAVVPTIVATYWRSRQDVAPVAPDPDPDPDMDPDPDTDPDPDPDPDLGHAANYLYTLTGERPDEAAVRGLETFLTTAVDHGLNPSTFTARTVVSTDSDFVSAATAAVGTLKGPRHGGNLARVSDLVREAHESGDPEAYVRGRVADGERPDLPGFGHRVYDVRDPRAAVLSAAAERLAEARTGGTTDDLLSTARTVERAGVEALREHHPDRPVAPTMEFHAVALLSAVGVPQELLPATFAVSRVGGWMAHCLEGAASDTLIRPSSRYVGATGRSWTPVEERTPSGGVASDTALEPVSETLATLAEPARLEILVALFDADEPLAYSTLRAATDIVDKGRFNYHLRRLRGSFVTETDDGYALTDPGATLVETVLTDDRLLGDVAE